MVKSIQTAKTTPNNATKESITINLNLAPYSIAVLPLTNKYVNARSDNKIVNVMINASFLNKKYSIHLGSRPQKSIAGETSAFNKNASDFFIIKLQN